MKKKNIDQLRNSLIWCNFLILKKKNIDANIQLKSWQLRPIATAQICTAVIELDEDFCDTWSCLSVFRLE